GLVPEESVQRRLQRQEHVRQNLLARDDRWRRVAAEHALGEADLENVETEAADGTSQPEPNEIEETAEQRLQEQLVTGQRVAAERGARRTEHQEAQQLRFRDLTGLPAGELERRRFGGAGDTNVDVELSALLIEDDAARGYINRRIGRRLAAETD